MVRAPIASWSDDAFDTTEIDFVLPFPNGTSGSTLPLHVSGAVFSGVADETGFVAGDDGDGATIRLRNGLAVSDALVELVELANFDRPGAL